MFSPYGLSFSVFLPSPPSALSKLVFNPTPFPAPHAPRQSPTSRPVKPKDVTFLKKLNNYDWKTQARIEKLEVRPAASQDEESHLAFFPPSLSSPPLLSLWHGPCLPPSSFELYTPYCFCALSLLKYSLRRLCTSCTSSRALHLVLPCILCYPIHRSRMWQSRGEHGLIRAITRLPLCP